MTVPPLPKTAVNFIWKPEHLLVAAGQKMTIKVANADYMQHNFTFKAAHVAQNLPADKTTTIELTAPTKPGLYRFYCKYHLQMMEGAVTVR
jgi:plastocyanin